MNIMKQTIGFCDFTDAFRAHDRKDQYTYEGLQLLFDWLETSYDELDEEYELDVIALCCEYSEDTPEAIADNYGIDISDCADSEAIQAAVLAHLEDETLVIGATDSTILYQAF
jgi:hypothetical protein